MILQLTHNKLTTQKASLCISKMSKLKKHSVAKTRSLWKLPICDDNFFADKKSPQRKFASATIANPAELMNGTTMN